MKIIRMALPVCIVALLFLLPCLAGNKKAFTATETLCYSCVCADCSQGTATALPGGDLQLRNREAIYFYAASDPRAAGYFRVSINTDTDLAFNGTLWGTFFSCDSQGMRIVDGWEGTWNGEIFGVFPSNWINKVAGHGTGANSGLTMEATTVYGDSLTGTVLGVIQDSNK